MMAFSAGKGGVGVLVSRVPSAFHEAVTFSSLGGGIDPLMNRTVVEPSIAELKVKTTGAEGGTFLLFVGGLTELIVGCETAIDTAVNRRAVAEKSFCGAVRKHRGAFILVLS